MDEVLTPEQVAQLLQLHLKTIYKFARQGVIPASRIGRRWRFSRNAIEAVVSERQQKPAVQPE